MLIVERKGGLFMGTAWETSATPKPQNKYDKLIFFFKSRLIELYQSHSRWQTSIWYDVIIIIELAMLIKEPSWPYWDCMHFQVTVVRRDNFVSYLREMIISEQFLYSFDENFSLHVLHN